jgi:hypothetical protein
MLCRLEKTLTKHATAGVLFPAGKACRGSTQEQLPFEIFRFGEKKSLK